MSIPFTPAMDVLGHTAPLDHHALFPFQGIPLEVKSNSPAVIEAAESCFGIWHKLEESLIASISPLPIRIIVHPGEQQQTRQTPFVYRVHSDCFLAAGGSNLLMAQMDPGAAIGFVTPEMVAEDTIFQDNVLMALASHLVMAHDRGPIHAGAVARNGRPVMLLGRSGAGKSTLCYACVREGFQLLTEDATFVSIKSGVRVWSRSPYIHLYPDASQYFPELAEIPPQVQPNGKIKITVDVKALGDDTLCLCAENPVICVLERHDCESSDLEPISSQTLVDTLCRDVESGYDLNKNLHQIAHMLAKGEKYRLVIGKDVNSAVERLKTLT